MATRLQYFAHATTAQLSCHAQNCVAIFAFESMWKQNEVPIEVELRGKTVIELGPSLLESYLVGESC